MYYLLLLFLRILKVSKNLKLTKSDSHYLTHEKSSCATWFERQDHEFSLKIQATTVTTKVNGIISSKSTRSFHEALMQKLWIDRYFWGNLPVVNQKSSNFRPFRKRKTQKCLWFFLNCFLFSLKLKIFYFITQVLQLLDIKYPLFINFYTINVFFCRKVCKCKVLNPTFFYRLLFNSLSGYLQLPFFMYKLIFLHASLW